MFNVIRRVAPTIRKYATLVSDAELKCISSNKSFGGYQNLYGHFSNSLQCNMQFGVYVPSGENENFPVLFFLSGLTYSEQDFITKGGFQKFAAEHKIIVVASDTSPSKFIQPLSLSM